MDYKTLSRSDELVLEGVTIVRTYEDDTLMSVLIKDKVGGQLLLKPGDYRGLKFMTPAPPPQVKRWFVESTKESQLNICEQFLLKRDAEERLNALAHAGQLCFTLVQREIPEDEAVKARPGTHAAPARPDDDLPF